MISTERLEGFDDSLVLHSDMKDGMMTGKTLREQGGFSQGGDSRERDLEGAGSFQSGVVRIPARKRPMKNGFKVMDSDMHIIEPPDLWQRYIDAEFKDQVPQGALECCLPCGVLVVGGP